MPLFVFGLRLFTLFLNVWDTYKVLKLPPPSSRNNGLPSQRALMQRKRDMKGTITVWIVWCCLVTYERFAEGFVSLVVPFYDEVKSIFLLFLIMTRARGCEPIFLHLIRPFLRPYTTTLDLLLDFFRMLGDMAFATILGPFSAVGGLLRVSAASSEESSEADNSEREASEPSNGPSRTNSSGLNQARRVTANGTLHARASSASLRSQMPRTVSAESTKSSGSNPQSRSYEIWHPPQSSHSDSEETLHDDSAPTEVIFLTEEAKEANEWRQYPSFPSAYPATPVFVQRTKLPAQNPSIPQPSLMGILEDSAHQEFDDSQADDEPESPTYERGMSEDLLRSPGARGLFSEEEMSADESGEGEYDEDDEDVFNTTLKTPPPARPRNLVPGSGQSSNRSSIGSILAKGGLKPQSSAASLHARTGSGSEPLVAPGMTRRQSSNSSVNSGRSVQSRTRAPIPKALRTGPMLKQSDVNAESDEDEEDNQPAPQKVTVKATIRPGQATRSIQPKAVKPTTTTARTQPAKPAATRKPARPLSDASLRNSNGTAMSNGGEKARPITQRRNTPLTQATNR